MAGYAAVAAVLAWRSLSWPLVHDAPIMHYIAWRIADGAAPYRDLFDMNQPGVYVLHLAVLEALGPGDLAWRAFDLTWLTLASVVIASAAARWGAVAAAGGALAFATYHLAGGAWQAGQRDFLLSPLLILGALGVARWLEARGRWGSLAWAGAAMGVAVTLKPHAGVLALGLGIVVIVAAARTGGLGAVIAAALAYGALAAVAPAAALAWLGATGALDAWRQAVFDYLLPLYSRLGRDAAWPIHRREVWIPLALGALLSVGALGRARRLGARGALALVGLAYGILHFLAQGKGWEYHLYPLAAFVAVLLFAGLGPAGGCTRALLVAALLAALVVLGLKGVEAGPARWERGTVARVRLLEADLRARLRPGDTVQVLDTTGGGAHALLRLGVRQPTRFLYDFHFFHDVDAPVVRALRAELIRGLDAAPPRFVVLFERGWPAGGYERLRAFPELAARLATRYTVVAARDGYRIHEKSDGP